jgi:hypothetical protein
MFGFAGLTLAASGSMQWRGRFASCPTDPALRNACLRTRKVSARIYALSLGVFAVGGWFSFVQPLLRWSADFCTLQSLSFK